MFALPWTRFQTRGTGGGARFGTLVVNAALAAGLFALAVASFVLGMARNFANMLAVQQTLARVLGVIYAGDRSRRNPFGVQIQLLTLPTFSLALRGAAAHRLVAQFGARNGGRVPVASSSFRMFAVWKLLQDLFLTLDGSQVFEQVAAHSESSI